MKGIKPKENKKYSLKDRIMLYPFTILLLLLRLVLWMTEITSIVKDKFQKTQKCQVCKSKINLIDVSHNQNRYSLILCRKCSGRKPNLKVVK